MENPSQINYTTEELFSLTPVEPPKQQQLQMKAKGDHLAAMPTIQTSSESLWSQHKWPILIFGTLVIGGVCYYYYYRRQKSKEENKG